MRTFAIVTLLLGATLANGDDFVVLFTTGPAWDASKPPADQAGFKEHSANLRRLRSAGLITMGARYASTGMIVLKAENETAARAELDKDPTIAAKVFSYELHPIRFFFEPACPSPEGSE